MWQDRRLSNRNRGREKRLFWQVSETISSFVPVSYLWLPAFAIVNWGWQTCTKDLPKGNRQWNVWTTLADVRVVSATEGAIQIAQVLSIRKPEFSVSYILSFVCCCSGLCVLGFGGGLDKVGKLDKDIIFPIKMSHWATGSSWYPNLKTARQQQGGSHKMQVTIHWQASPCWWAVTTCTFPVNSHVHCALSQKLASCGMLTSALVSEIWFCPSTF